MADQPQAVQRSGADLCSHGPGSYDAPTMFLPHNVGGGALPAPPWLLSCIGAFAVPATAVVTVLR